MSDPVRDALYNAVMLFGGGIKCHPGRPAIDLRVWEEQFESWHKEAAAALRDDGWVRVATDGLPKCGTPKPADLAWIVWDGMAMLVTTVHPTWWSRTYFHNVTHWRPLPAPPSLPA